MQAFRKEICSIASSFDVHRLQSRAFGPAPSHGTSSRYVYIQYLCLQARCITNPIFTPFLLHIDTATSDISYRRNRCANQAALEFWKITRLHIDTLGLSYTRSVCETGRHSNSVGSIARGLYEWRNCLPGCLHVSLCFIGFCLYHGREKPEAIFPELSDIQKLISMARNSVHSTVGLAGRTQSTSFV